MSEREQFNVRIDETVANRFRSFVQDHRGDCRGALGRETENALREYMDNDRGARIEANLDILLDEIQEVKTILDQKDGIHTQTSADSDRQPETMQKLERIASMIQSNSADNVSVKEEYVERSIKRVAGANPQTIRHYKSELKSEGLAFEHPGQASLWYLDEEQFFKKLDYCSDWREIIGEYSEEMEYRFLSWENPEEEGGDRK